jgi:hypothetical protein
MKKNICILLLFSSLVFSQDTIIDATAIYKETLIGKIDTRDTFCFNELNRATSDFNNGHMIYYHSFGIYNMRNLEYLKKEVINHNLKFELYPISDLVFIYETDTFTAKDDCYYLAMNKLVLKQFGKRFFEKLDTKADSLYVAENKDSLFDYIERYNNFKCFKKKKNSKSYEIIDLKKELISYIKYPKKFIFKNEEKHSFTSCEFIIGKDGNISDLKTNTTFQNSENNKFKKYFERKIKSFLKKTKWSPYQLYGYNLKCIWGCTFHYK